MFCRKCGKELLSDSSFCDKCGTKVAVTAGEDAPRTQGGIYRVKPAGSAARDVVSRGASPKPRHTEEFLGPTGWPIWIENCILAFVVSGLFVLYEIRDGAFHASSPIWGAVILVWLMAFFALVLPIAIIRQLGKIGYYPNQPAPKPTPKPVAPTPAPKPTPQPVAPPPAPKLEASTAGDVVNTRIPKWIMPFIWYGCLAGLPIPLIVWAWIILSIWTAIKLGWPRWLYGMGIFFLVAYAVRLLIGGVMAIALPGFP